MTELSILEAEILQLESELSAKRQRIDALRNQLGKQSDKKINCQQAGQTGDCDVSSKHLQGLQKLFDAIPEPIMIINRDFTIAMANRIIWQSMPDGHPGQPPTCHKLTHDLDRPCSGVEHPCPVQEVLRTKRPTRVEHIHYDKNGRELHVEIIAAPILDEHDEIIQIIEICRDISDRKRNEAAISNQLEFLKTLIETIPNPIFYKDAEGVYLGCNTAFEQATGLSKERVVGKTVYDVSPKELADRYHAADCDLMKKRGVQVYESQVRYADGILHDVVFSKATFLKGDGSVGGLVGVMVDITNARRTAKALEESVSRFNAFMDNLPALAFIKDQSGRYVYLNRAVEPFYNQTVDQRLGKTDHELWPSAIAENIVINDRKVLQEGKVFRTQETVEVEGHEKHHLVVKFPISEEKQPVLLAGVAIDMTDLRAAEQEKEALQRRLETSHRMEALGTLAGGIAHDFNNILTAILGYVELAVMKSADYPDIRNYLSRVLTASNRARELVKQILAFSRQSNEQPRPVMIRPIVQEALKLLRATLPATTRLEQNLDSEDATMADPTRLHQIVMNLCANAIYAMKESGGTLRVNLSTIVIEPAEARHFPDLIAGSYIKLTIRDTGSGISPKHLEHIFEPFYTTKPKEDGSGMGLSVVHGIVKSCNGTIRVESRLGEGSCFDVYLPRIATEPLRKLEEESPLPIGKERILFVDDEKLQTELAEEALSQLGYDVTTYTDSIMALEHFIKQPDYWDLLVTDMAMPDMAGDILGRQIKSIRPDMPMLICTGYSENLNEERARQIGFSGFVLKPLIIKDMARLIRGILDQSPEDEAPVGIPLAQ